MSFMESMKRQDFNPDISYEGVRPLLRWTYAWMVLGLLITTVVAYTTVTSEALLSARTSGGIVFGAIIAQFALVIGLTWALPRISAGIAALMFIAYSALTGFTLSVLLLIYTDASVFNAFVATTALFGVMTVFAFTTNLDLSKWGSYLIIGVIGLVIAIVVNMFLRSTMVETLISAAGVLIFTGLVAYDTQKIKRLAASPELQADGTLVSKYSIYMALQLYLDFVNLFIFLLRLLGSRRS